MAGGLMEFLKSPAFGTYLSGLGQGLVKADRGQGFDMGNTPQIMAQMMQQRQMQEQLQGLMGNLDPGKRKVLEAYAQSDPQGALGIMAKQAFQGPEKQPSAVQQYEYYRQQAEAAGQQPMSFMEFQQAVRQSGATNVNVNTGSQAPQVGTIPKGWQLQQTPEGAWQMAPIEGGPAAREIAESEEQQARAQEAEAATKKRYGGVVLEDISRVKEKVENSVLPVTGTIGSLVRQIPGTDAFDVSALTNTIKANIGFDRLQQMREASPTGGALGQVSERELDFLNSTLGNLDQSQSEEQFIRNLDRLEQVYKEIMRKAAAYPNAEEYGFADGAAQQDQSVEMEKEVGGQRYIKMNGQWYKAP